jgi:hypothetical protein
MITSTLIESLSIDRFERRRMAKTRRAPTEHDEQVILVRWFRMQFPGVRIFAVPNGGHRNPVTARKLKDDGVESGVPDLYCPAWRLWVEMKRTVKGTTSTQQKDWHEYLQGVGDTVMVCHGASAAMAEIREFARRRSGP